MLPEGLPTTLPTDPVKRAGLVGAYAHAGQTRKPSARFPEGEPYMDHPDRVMLLLGDEEPDLLAAALLHDTVEDTQLTREDLLDLGFSTRTVGLVDAVTRRKGQSRLPDQTVDETYREFTARVAKHHDKAAVTLKMADLADNTDPALKRLDGVTMQSRYKQALETLKTALEEGDDTGHRLALLVRQHLDAL